MAPDRDQAYLTFIINVCTSHWPGHSTKETEQETDVVNSFRDSALQSVNMRTTDGASSRAKSAMASQQQPAKKKPSSLMVKTNRTTHYSIQHTTGGTNDCDYQTRIRHSKKRHRSHEHAPLAISCSTLRKCFLFPTDQPHLWLASASEYESIIYWRPHRRAGHSRRHTALFYTLMNMSNGNNEI